MQKRTAVVNNIKINTVEFSSILTLGDTAWARPKMKTIAVQQEGAIFNDDEDLSFNEFPLFQRETNWPKQLNNVYTHTIHHIPTINVQNASTDINTSSIFQVGSIANINSEARIKYFRRLLNN